MLQFELLRWWSPTQRLLQAGSLMRSARQLSLNAHRQRFPQLSTVELGQKLARTWLQEYCPVAYIPEFSRIQLTRRQMIPISTGKDVYFASPEDVIINKLWGKQSQSEKQWRDVLSIMKTQRESLEYNYLREWADRLGITPDYLQATIEAGVSDFT